MSDYKFVGVSDCLKMFSVQFRKQFKDIDSELSGVENNNGTTQ